MTARRTKPKQPLAKWLRMLPLIMLLMGCRSIHQRLDNSSRLMNRPDWPLVKAAAPEWARDALKTINALEYEIESK